MFYLTNEKGGRKLIFIPLFSIFNALTFSVVIRSSSGYYCYVKRMIYVGKMSSDNFANLSIYELYYYFIISRKSKGQRLIFH